VIDALRPTAIHRIEVAEVLYRKEEIDTHHQTETIDIHLKIEVIDTRRKIEAINSLHPIAVIEMIEAAIDSLLVEEVDLVVVVATNKKVTNQEKEVALTKVEAQKG
jgi:hypothetical protein